MQPFDPIKPVVVREPYASKGACTVLSRLLKYLIGKSP